MKEINEEILKDTNISYIPLYRVFNRELVLYGGAGAGKSYYAAQNLINYCLKYTHKKILIIRKTYPALKLTCLELIENLLHKYNIPYDINKSELIIRTYITNNRLIFKNIDDPEKIKSITDVDLIWVEEPTEITERDYDIINMRLRGRELEENEYRQIIMTFNPIDRNHWIFKRFFERSNNAYKQKFTYKDNKYIDKDFIKILEDLKNQDIYAYQVYCLGEWGTLQGQIYTNYVIEDFDFMNFDEVTAGLDFGYNNPTAYLIVGIKDDEIYIIDEIYKTQLTTPEIIELIKEKNKLWDINPVIYCDVEPDRITELVRAGLKVIGAKKNVIEGINFLKTKKIHIHPRCINTIKEIQGYKYKQDKNGNLLEEPLKFNDHTLDALRYATTDMRKSVLATTYVATQKILRGSVGLKEYIERRRKYG